MGCSYFAARRLEYLCNRQAISHQFEIPGILTNKETSVAVVDCCQTEATPAITGVWAGFSEPPVKEISAGDTKQMQRTINEQPKIDEQKTCSEAQRDNAAPPKSPGMDPRNMKREDLVQIIEQSEVLNAEQKSQLSEVLVKYLPSLTDKPGKCKLLKYEFKVKVNQPVRSFSRPVLNQMKNLPGELTAAIFLDH
jgi:hypothetical protein